MGLIVRRRFDFIAIALTTITNTLYVASHAQAWEQVGAVLAQRARQRQADPESLVTARIEAAKKRLIKTIGHLDDYLKTQGQNGRTWQRFLRLDGLRGALAANEPDDEPLLISLERFRGNFAGLERSVCLNVASALERYLRVGGELARTTTAADINQKLSELATTLEPLNFPLTREQASAIGKLLGWFSARGQEADLVHEIRARLGQPNLHAHLSQAAIAGGPRKIDEKNQPVRDVIRGTRVYGVRNTSGWVHTRLVPDERRALFETTFTATNWAQTMSYNRSVRIASTSVTSLRGVKRYFLDEKGFHAWPATTRARVRSRILGVGSSRRGLRGRIVSRAVGRRIGGRKSSAEQIGARHVERQVNARFDAETEQRLRRAHADYLSQFRHPLLRMGQWPRWLRLTSTAEQLRIDARHESDSRLAATSAPPGLPQNAAVAVELHESLANSYGEGLLAGRTVRQADVDTLSLELLRRLPKPLELDEKKGAWSMTFVHRDPIDVRIDDGQVWLTLRASRFQSAKQTIDQELEITVHYFLENDNGVLRARRGNDVQIRSPDGDRTLSAADADLIRRRARDLLAAEISSRDLAMPGQMASFGRLNLTDLLAENGWLSLGWSREKAK